MKTEQAIKWAGGTQKALADALGLRQASIANWGEYPPALRQLQIERVSKGELLAEGGIKAALWLDEEAA